jgi:hypothetical protein
LMGLVGLVWWNFRLIIRCGLDGGLMFFFFVHPRDFSLIIPCIFLRFIPARFLFSFSDQYSLLSVSGVLVWVSFRFRQWPPLFLSLEHFLV